MDADLGDDEYMEQITQRVFSPVDGTCIVHCNVTVACACISDTKYALYQYVLRIHA